jgi:hypothetical protein
MAAARSRNIIALQCLAGGEQVPPLPPGIHDRQGDDAVAACGRDGG